MWCGVVHSIDLSLCYPRVFSTLVWQLILALEWKDASRDYHDVLTSAFDHPSYLQLQTNKQVKHPNTFLYMMTYTYIIRRDGS